MLNETILYVAGASAMILILGDKWKILTWLHRHRPAWWVRLFGAESCDLCQLFWPALLVSLVLNGLGIDALVTAFCATPFAFALWSVWIYNS